jgi:predicted NAD/FAD-binding protein
MTEETAKQMTWHKNDKCYHPDKMVHPSDGEAWNNFNDKHRLKSDEARNVRVALATDRVQSLWHDVCLLHMLARVCYHPQSPPWRCLSTT